MYTKCCSMKTSVLFQKIKDNLECYRDKVQPPWDQGLKHTGKTEHILQTMSRYNWDNFQEMNSSASDFTGKVNIDDINDMEARIDNYFQLHGNDDDAFKEFIKGISIYLSFVVRQPLHPPGIVFSNKKRVYEIDGIFYCTGKKGFLKDELSLCKYCICLPKIN